jgi:transcriptional regulator with XRE-family HTH domain
VRLSAQKPKSSSYPAELKTLGDHIRTRRLDLGLRQSDVAEFVGAYTSTVNTWENRHFSPDVRFVPKIIEFLGYDPFGAPPTTFPEQLKAARVAAGLTRRQLAAMIGVHPGTVAEWERGEVEPLEFSGRQLKALFWRSFEEDE